MLGELLIYLFTKTKKAMSHVEGHVQKPPTSPGELTMALGTAGQKRIKFDNPGWSLKIGDQIGFHPVLLSDGTVYAADIVDWKVHESAENELLEDSKLKLKQSGIDTIEKLYYYPKIRNKVKQALANGEFPNSKVVIEKSFNYLDSDDFERFYIETDGSIRAQKKVVAIIEALNS